MMATQHDRNERTELANGDTGIVLSPEQKRSRRNRNVAIGIAVGFFVLLFYAVTIAKLGSHVLDRSL